MYKDISQDLKKIYEDRFSLTYNKRELTWNILCKYFFQKYIKNNESVIEIAAGYCHFINNIIAQRKIALDLNPDVREYASKDVEVIINSSENISQVSDKTIDLVFISNFFEHITKQQIINTLVESNRILKDEGKIIILQPSIRYLSKEYWMFFDHITPLDEFSLSEALYISGFNKIKVISKFLPYTMQGKLPVFKFLIILYLKIPLLWKIFGKQSLLIFKKSKENTN